MQKMIVLGALLVACANVLAQEAGQRNPDFLKLDGNEDHFISREEAKADPRVARFFRRADMDQDGRLSEDEWLKARSMADRQKAGAYVDDSALTARVKAALLAKKGISSADISVETDHGVVRLSGFVDGAAQVRLAGRTARAVKGVRSVRNGLNAKSRR